MKKWLFVLIPVSISLTLWLVSKEDLSLITIRPWKSIAQVFGLTLITVITLQFVLSSRLKIIDDFFKGLDKAYKLHATLGIFIASLLLLHPLSLILNNPITNGVLLYLFPSTLPSYTFGVLALYTFLLLIIITLFAKLKYHQWKSTHLFMNVGLIFASLHVLLIPSDVSSYPPLRVWSILLITIANLCAFYKRFIWEYKTSKHEYVVENLNTFDKVHEIYLKPLNKKIEIKPGQFVFISFDNPSLGKETHPFSVSSDVNKDILRLSIKESGDYTSHLKDLKVGDKAYISNPYGKLGENLNREEDQIWIAGGIGITPFLSILYDFVNRDLKSQLTLFYSTVNNKEDIYTKEIRELIKDRDNIKLINWYSEEQGYINAHKVQRHVGDIKDKTILLCGPYKMMESLKKGFLDMHVEDDHINFEDFKFNE